MIKTVIVAVLMFILTGFSTVLAQVHEATVKVDGLSCPFCAYGLEKKLKKVEGVEKLEIKVDEGIAKITVKKGKSLAINGVEKAVKDGGFTPREISITVTGKLNEQNEQTVLTIPDSRQFFFLVPNEQLSKVEEMLDGKDRTLKLTGKVEKRKVEKSENSSHILTIKHFEVL